MDRLVLPGVTAQAMFISLPEAGQRHPEEFILLFLDGAGRHRANSLVILEYMRIEARPPYRPQPNPVEPRWDEVREQRFANEVLDSLDGVEDRLGGALAALERGTGVDWPINCPLTATEYDTGFTGQLSHNRRSLRSITPKEDIAGLANSGKKCKICSVKPA